MKKLGLTLTIALFLCSGLSIEAKNNPVSIKVEDNSVSEEHVGTFEAEGKKIDVKFVRVLYAAEGSEREGEGNSVEQLVFDSKDPQGNDVQVYRYQIVAKNTGYDELQTDQEEGDYKLKSVAEGVKLHIEVPLQNGKPQFDKAYIGNLAYNFGTRETRHNLSKETVSNIDFNIKRFELPTFGSNHKPGDKGIIYNEGYIEFTMTSKAKYIGSDQIGDFNINVKGPISITHVRGKERQNNAVAISEEIVENNI